MCFVRRDFTELHASVEQSCIQADRGWRGMTRERVDPLLPSSPVLFRRVTKFERRPRVSNRAWPDLLPSPSPLPPSRHPPLPPTLPPSRVVFAVLLTAPWDGKKNGTSSPEKIFVALFYAPMPRRNVWCASIFAGAAFTDWLDGYIARRQGIVTPFGSFLDPVADKV